MRFQTKEHILRVDKSDITGENAFHGDLFENQDNHESRKNEINLVSDIFAHLLLVL